MAYEKETKLDDKEFKDSLGSRGKICTINCGFPIVRQMSKKFGMTETSDEFDTWTVYWTDRFPSADRFKFLKRFQRINHLPGMLEICRKDELSKNLNRMLSNFPREYDFFPKTWCLPQELSELLNYAKKNPKKIFIFKPSRGSLGRGIFLSKTIEHTDLMTQRIGQVYISRPFLIDGFKFDLRLYVLVSSCLPLRLYVYNEGLARFATQKYEPADSNLHDKYMHLTNYAVNKNSSNFVIDEKEGSKRKLSTIYDWFIKHKYDAKKIWESIDDVIIKTILVALPQMRLQYKHFFPYHVDNVAGFELLGFDFILDSKLKPYLLEVNHTPSFTRCTPLDKEVKDGLMRDTFSLLNLSSNEYSRVCREEKYLLNERLYNKMKMTTSRIKARHEQMLRDKEQWELMNIGNFRRIYPCLQMNKYKPLVKATAINSRYGGLVGKKGASPFNSEEPLRKNPFTLLPSLTNSSNEATVKKLLLESYNAFNEMHSKIKEAQIKRFNDEIEKARNNSWTTEPDFAASYEAHREQFVRQLSQVLKAISVKTDIVLPEKEKLSSIFLKTPTSVKDWELLSGSTQQHGAELETDEPSDDSIKEDIIVTANLGE